MPPAARPVERNRIVAGRIHENEARRVDALGVIAPRPSAARCRPWPPRPAIFPGCWSARLPCCRAWDCRRSCPRSGSDIACSRATKPSSFSATCRLRARRTSRCSAPKISVVSASTGRAARAGQHVRADAQRRVGGDAGERIRAAAVQSQHDFRRGRLNALLGRGTARSARAISLRAASTVAARAAARLQRHARPAGRCAAHPRPSNDRSGSPRSPGPESSPPRRWDGPARRPASAAS